MIYPLKMVDLSIVFGMFTNSSYDFGMFTNLVCFPFENGDFPLVFGISR